MASFCEYSGEAPPIPYQLNRCNNHQLNYKLICLDECDKQGLIFKCRICAKEAPNKKYMNLSEFMYSTDRHVFDYLPNISSQLKLQLIQTLNLKYNKIKEVEHFFNEIKLNILKSIEGTRKQMFEKISNVSKFKESLAKEYKKITKKDEIKKIIDDKSTIEEKSKNIKEKISDILRKSKENQDIINKILMQQQEDIKSLEQTELLNLVQKGLYKMLVDFGHENKHQDKQLKQKKDMDLNLRSNQIGAQHLNSSLEKLNNLWNNSIGDEGGAQHLSSSLAKLNNLTSLHLNFNRHDNSSTHQQHQHKTGGTAHKQVHYPSQKFAVPIEHEPEYTNNMTKAILTKYRQFIYDCSEFEDYDTVELGYYKFENGSVYKGQWKNGIRHGRGKQLWEDGSIYEGYWKNNMAHGKGRMIYSDADVYEGEWKNDKANGEGTYIHADGVKYVGQWVNNNKEGEGVETQIDGAKYEGQFKQGKKHGRGKYFWADGQQYNGEFSNNNIEGVGTYDWTDGRNYKGGWKNHQKNGFGVFVWSDKRKYCGHYLEDKKDGYGEFEWPDGRKYKGNWRNGKQHGISVYINAQNKEMRGEWVEGKRVRWINEGDN